MNTLRRLLAVVVTVLALGVSSYTPAHATSGWGAPVAGCFPDATPGVVTADEVGAVHPGMTRHEVACVFGVHGHALYWSWGDGRYFHLYVKYRTPDCYIIVDYIDKHDTGTLTLLAVR